MDKTTMSDLISITDLKPCKHGEDYCTNPGECNKNKNISLHDLLNCEFLDFGIGSGIDAYVMCGLKIKRNKNKIFKEVKNNAKEARI